MARISGAISIYSIETGDFAPMAETEWVEPCSLTTKVVNKSLFGLECTIRTSTKTDFFLDDDLSDQGFLSKSLSFIKGLVYYLTELENLKPDSLPVETITREYSLFQLEQTTPAKMYLR